MYCGTMPCNKETDLGHLANIVFVYNQLDDEFDFNKHYVMGQLQSFLDRFAKKNLNNLSAIYMDLCHIDLNPDDDGLSTFVNSNDDDTSTDSKLWTLECLVGWCIHDAFVTYLHKNETDIAFELYVLKNEWHNSIREDTIKGMRHVVDKYNELLARENSRFYLESGEVFN